MEFQFPAWAPRKVASTRRQVIFAPQETGIVAKNMGTAIVGRVTMGEQSSQSEPLILSTWNFGAKACAAGWRVLSELGGCAIEAVEAGCQAVEADPEVLSVGVGGLPDATGQVSLDAAIMLSPEKSAGVAFIRCFPHPIRLARLVMEHSPHKLLVGEGAERFGRSIGLEEQPLRTWEALVRWRRWLAGQIAGPQVGEAVRHGAEDSTATIAAGVDVSNSTPASVKGENMAGEPFPAETCLPQEIVSPSAPYRSGPSGHDTVGVIARDKYGEIAAGCSTSGLPFKLPGRVGDSPLIGHGLYVDPCVGAAVATGTGELIMGVCGSFLAVECLRRGASPREAAIEVIHRIERSFRQLEGKQAAVIVLDVMGRWAAAALRPGFVVAVRSPHEEALREPDFVLSPAS